MDKIIVSMTSWPARITNLPAVIDSILLQKRLPDKIVVNLAEDEFPRRKLPMLITNYFATHKDILEVNWVEKNTHVWKKFLPTFELYPDDIIIPIDDDFLYPKNMITELMDAHTAHPGHPVSGNKVTWYGMTCHCGSCSLIKREWFEQIIPLIDDELMAHCYSSDFAYTYLLKLMGYTYVRTEDDFSPKSVTEYNPTSPYSHGMKSRVPESFKYLNNRFQMIKKPKVFYSVPWSSDKNIGGYYNEFAKLVPDDAYICFIDADTIFTTPDYGRIIEESIIRYPDVEAFTCKTNRVGCKWQIAERSDWSNDDMKFHRKVGAFYRDTNGCICEDRTDQKLFSGLFLVIKKSAWDAIGGAPEDGMLGIDNAIHKRLRDNGMKLYCMMGLYLYHWYRGGDRNYTKHLK